MQKSTSRNMSPNIDLGVQHAATHYLVAESLVQVFCFVKKHVEVQRPELDLDKLTDPFSEQGMEMAREFPLVWDRIVERWAHFSSLPLRMPCPTT